MINARISSTFTRLKDHPHSQYWLIAAITLLAAAFRFYKLGEWSFWIDEIFTIERTQAHFGNLLEVLRNLPSRLWFPLSFVFTRFALDAFGVTEFSARLVSTSIGIITIPILFFSSRKYFGIGVALILSLLLAISPWHVFWSQNARFYTSLMLLYTLASLIFFYALENDRPWSFVIVYGLLYLAMSERLQAAFLLPVAFAYMGSIWLFRFERPAGLRRRNLIIFLIPFVLMLLYELIRYAFQGGSITTSFVEGFGGQQIGDPFRLTINILSSIGIPIVALAMISAIYLLIKKNRIGLFLLISALLPVVLLVLLNPLLFTKDRYVFMTLPFWLLLAALAIHELWTHSPGLNKLLAAGVLVIFMAHAGSALLVYYQVNNGNRLFWREAYGLVLQDIQPEDEVVSFWPEFGPYYLDREILPWENISIEDIRQSGKRHWFVLDSETMWINPVVLQLLDEQAELIELLYLRIPENNNFLRIYLYNPETHSLEQ
jgi:mannosyltransferase